MTAMVRVRGLRKRYGSVDAARDVTLEVEAGEVFGLLGPNGAGKTTTVECIVGLREPDEGEIVVCGIDARRHPAEVKQKIGAALQTNSLQDKITPREALALFGSFYRERSDPGRLLERFALGEKADAPFDTLSGGQRQRLALALAFVNRPELVLLDEPTTGLDPQSRRELHAEISRMRDEGHTVMLTTHHIDEAERLCDRVAVIDHGRVIATGTPRQLIAASGASPSISLETSEPLDPEDLRGVPGLRDLVQAEGSTHFRTSDARAAVSELSRILEGRGIALVALHVETATLEDVFIELTGSSLRE